MWGWSYIDLMFDFFVLWVGITGPLMIWTAKLYQKPRGQKPDGVEYVMWYLVGVLATFGVFFCFMWVLYLNRRLSKRQIKVKQRRQVN